ncbi:MAG: Na+/H+ antiporter subunit D, partial [Microlunatus sp.]|nr:Na+/H+ antiporter subunit D [Microlunatus sp.]
TSLLTLYAVAKVWNRAFWRAVPESTPAGNPLVVRRRSVTLPRGMVVSSAFLVLVGVGITFVAGPLYGYAERSAADMLSGVPYVQAVLPTGVR